MENRDKRIYKVTLTGGIVNMLLLVFKFVAGVLGNSAAMIADAVHSLSDFLTDIVVIAFVKLSSKPADQDHDYGHGKYETVASSIIGMALVVVAVLLGWGGVEKIIQVAKGEQLEQPGVIALVAAVLSVALKEWVFRITKKVALDVNSQALEANAWHHRSDAMSSVGTSIGIGGAVLLGKSWAVLDPIASVVVSIMILIAAFRLLRQASGELLEESLPKATEDKIESIVYQDKLVTDIHHLHTRRIGSIIAVEMHLRLPGDITLEESHHHATRIEQALRAEFGAGTHIMLHIEPVKVNESTGQQVNRLIFIEKSEFLMIRLFVYAQVSCTAISSLPIALISFRIMFSLSFDGFFVPLMYWAIKLWLMPIRRAMAEAFNSGWVRNTREMP